LHKFFIVRKQQIFVLGGGVILLISLMFFGKTINPNKPKETPTTAPAIASLNFNELLSKAKTTLNASLQKKILSAETANNQATELNKIATYKQLATLWKDSGNMIEPYLFYTSEAAKLENSEKSLTFAAQQFTSNLLDVEEPTIQNWLATNAKVLFDKALLINPNNDSSKIGLGACYIFGNISDNPMTGILPVREIAAKNPNNLYAQMVLGLGGKKSRQFDKAIERFLIIANKEPNNAIISIHLAECYEQKADKENAVKWYLVAKNLIPNKQIKKEIEKRINALK
jgi:tetratricopeptide (TPR) repeat protein